MDLPRPKEGEMAFRRPSADMSSQRKCSASQERVTFEEGYIRPEDYTWMDGPNQTPIRNTKRKLRIEGDVGVRVEVLT